jgi:chemotaxis protein MotA
MRRSALLAQLKESLVFGIVGLVLLFGCVFGVFVAHGGNLEPIIEAAPPECATILGAAIAAMLIGNDLDTVKGVAGGFGKIFGGSKWKKQDFLDVIFLVSRLMKILRVDGPVALEAHVESPDTSAIFGEYPKIMKDHHLLHLITDNIRLMVISSGNLNAYAVEEVMDASIKEHAHHAQHPAHALNSMAGALPALGIVACVLGVVKTMGAIDQPPTILGGLIGSALVGTFIGVFLAYGIVEPMAGRLGAVCKEEMQIYHVVKQIIVASLHGHPQPLVIEAARVTISSHNQPSFAEVFDGLRGK